MNTKFDYISKPDEINLTSGASYGIANILSSVTSSITKQVFVVTPTYFLINNVFQDFNLKTTAIDETKDGIDLVLLEDNLKKYKIDESIVPDSRRERKLYNFILYMVPTFSNPGGITYSIETRKKLVTLARKYDMLIICDDVYEFLDYTNSKPLPRLNHLDNSVDYGNTISNASFSKIIAPGLRVGWQQTTPKLAKQLSITGANKSGGTPNQLSTFVVQELIKSGKLDEIINKFIKVYSERSETFKACIKKYIPNAEVYGGDGGYFFWIKTNVDNDKVHALLKNKVSLAKGDNFEVTGDTRDYSNSNRLSISYLSSVEIEQGRNLPPNYHEFSLYDIRIRYTFFNQVTIPVGLLVLISGVLPVLQFVLFAFIIPASLTRRLWDLFAGCLCLLGAQATQLMTVVLLKNITGLPRPDMIERCEPFFTDVIPLTQLSTVEVCTQENWNLVQEGFRTFPSGHSSTVFCGMIITSLNIAARLQTFDNRNNSFKVFLTISPLLLASFVASTRVSDNRHYLLDVIAGSFIGFTIGWIFYYQYYPSIFNLKNQGKAFPPRRFGIQRFLDNVGGFWRIDDDTERTLDNDAIERGENIA
ncbi:unnamed protein product [Candida verbasci]|uniref:Phosphatidic acid phosphatase type 2/haloperoxidase domain-containing protein n=1 Tax=Candida verbasci TaxID=1227364 RepID=A0A9W4U3G1_9ASCO|nr:unnamed protein product [Candida verbasci]